jgi:hypothetical protein
MLRVQGCAGAASGDRGRERILMLKIAFMAVVVRFVNKCLSIAE